jgi:hypothetical protein
LEKQHSEQSIDKEGHVVTVIQPLTGELWPLQIHFWSRLDAVLDPKEQQFARGMLALVPQDTGAEAGPRDLVLPGLLGWGKNGARFEIWREGAWFYWQVHSGGQNYGDTAPELPEEYRRFWKEPSQKTGSPTR